MRAVNILIKPSSSNCNMRCKYCFYFDEADNRSTPSFGFMDDTTMFTLIEKALQHAAEQCVFGFQGGEPMLVGLSWFERFVDCVQQLNTNNIQVSYALQTNGTLINEAWAHFFAQNNFLVGVSLDGPRKFHDYYRRDNHNNGSFARIMNNIKILQDYNVNFNTLTVVTARSACNIKDIYRFFINHNLLNHQYILCLDPIEGSASKSSYALSPTLCLRFLTDLFDVWYTDRRAGIPVYNRYFENLAGLLKGCVPETCSMRGMCSAQYAVEADGSVYPCDFYMTDPYYLGNITTDSFGTIDNTRQKIGFIERSCKLSKDCFSCRWLAVCRGGCYRDRLIDPENGTSLNKYCEIYKKFFAYAIPRLSTLL